jgi:hypothetical protein
LYHDRKKIFVFHLMVISHELKFLLQLEHDNRLLSRGGGVGCQVGIEPGPSSQQSGALIPDLRPALPDERRTLTMSYATCLQFYPGPRNELIPLLTTGVIDTGGFTVGVKNLVILSL